MSRIEKLKSLLARVEQRRAEPRLVAVSGGHSLSSANTNLAAPAQGKRASPLELSPRATPTPSLAPPAQAAPIEEAFAPSPPSSIPPPSIHEAETKLRSSLPPPTTAGSRADDARSAQAPSSTVPPPAAPDLRSRADESAASRSSPSSSRADEPRVSTTEVLPAAPTRIAPSPTLAFDSAVRVTSSPRLDTAKTFGELLEQSLALRPKSG